MIDKEREELYRIIWGIADDVRCSINGWEFKSYVLGFLFYKYLSDDFEFWIKEKNNNIILRNASKNSKLKRDAIKEKGYFINPKYTFLKVLHYAERHPKDYLCRKLEKIFREIESANGPSEKFKKNISRFNGMLTYMDLNNEKLGKDEKQKHESILKIMKGISRINFSKKKIYECDSDVFGDAYEYIISMQDTNAGQSGGEFYTPPEVSELLIKLCMNSGCRLEKIYDPACGSGSLLLKFLKLKECPETRFFGQEINPITYKLCKMNMFLHGLNFDRFDIRCGDTLLNDEFKSKKFDVIVSNPPYSIEWMGKEDPELIKDKRFRGAGILAPKEYADMAFIQHSIYHLNKDGVAAIVCSPGIFYRGKEEQKIRKWLVNKNFVDAIIKLPENLFFGTSIFACVMILKKTKRKNTGVLFIDASDFFIKGKSRNRLQEEGIKKIMDLYSERTNKKNYSFLAKLNDLAKENYDLSVNTYVVKEKKKDTTNIQKLNKDIFEISLKINDLRKQLDDLVKRLYLR